jgi:hypothetical protein
MMCQVSSEPVPSAQINADMVSKYLALSGKEFYPFKILICNVSYTYEVLRWVSSLFPYIGLFQAGRMVMWREMELFFKRDVLL